MNGCGNGCAARGHRGPSSEAKESSAKGSVNRTSAADLHRAKSSGHQDFGHLLRM
jgi:hypothetical protein